LSAGAAGALFDHRSALVWGDRPGRCLHGTPIFAFFNLLFAIGEVALFYRVGPRQLITEDRTARYIDDTVHVD
jgi:hypothetical protein